jgi:hypothetical protein
MQLPGMAAAILTVRQVQANNQQREQGEHRVTEVEEAEL